MSSYEQMDAQRYAVDNNGAQQQSAGTTFATTGNGTFNMPDAFMFGYSFINQPTMTYGCELDNYDPDSDIAIISQGYTWGWIQDDQNLYVGAYIGVRIFDGPATALATHHFHFRELALKDPLSSPAVPAGFSVGSSGSPAVGDGTRVWTSMVSNLGDGNPPSSSPVPTVKGGVGDLFVQWTAITNSSPVTYDVHVSTSNAFTPSSATLAASTTASLAVVKTLQSGVSLVPNSPSTQASTLSSALSTSGAITSLPVAALSSVLANGAVVEIDSGTNSQQWTLTAAAAIGATSLTVASQTPNFAYPSGSVVSAVGAPSTYYVAIVARDVDGTAPPSAWVGPNAPRVAGTNDIDVNWVYANGINANQITGGAITAGVTISGQIATATNGARVAMDANGLHVYGSDGSLEVDLNISGSNYFSGNADIGNLTVEGTTQLRGATTVMAPVELTAGNLVTLDGANPVTVGNAAPTLSIDWLTIGIAGSVTGSSVQWSGGKWIIATTNSSGGVLLQCNADGSNVGTPSGMNVPAGVTATYGGGIASGGANYLVGRAGNGNVYIYDLTHGYYNAVASDSHVTACFDQGGTYIWTCEQNAGLAGPLMHRYDPSLITGSGANYSGTPLVVGLNSWPSGWQIIGVAVLTGDLGAATILVSAANGSARQVFAYDPGTGNRITGSDFKASGALGWDGSNFWSLVNSNLVKHEGGSHVLSGVSTTWYGAYTWRNAANNYETPIGRVSSVTMYSRARITIGGVTLPSGVSVDHVGLYLGTGSAPANLHLQAATTGAGQLLGTPSYGSSATLANMSGVNPQTGTSAFPNQPVAYVKSGGGYSGMFGDGTAQFGAAAGAGGPSIVTNTSQAYIADPVVGGVNVNLTSGKINLNGQVVGNNNWTTTGLVQGANVTATSQVAGATGSFSGQVVATQFQSTSPATTSGTVAVIASNGVIAKQSSSRRYKKFIRDITDISPASLLKLRPRRFEYRKKDPVSGQTVTDVGFIAEEARDLGLDPFVRYDEKGRPDGFHYDRWTAALQIIVRHQADQIADLTARLEALEAR